MTDLAVFTYSNLEVRTVVRDGEPWFVAADVCAVLGIGNARQAVTYLDDDEVLQAPVITNDGSERELPTNLINEAGLYSLILRSRKPEAKAFKRWITHEVLPAIRKTGRYEVAPAIPQTYAEALQLAADQARQLEAQAEQIAVAAPKAEAWDHLATADGDYAVADAAKILSRHPLVQVGRDRLFAHMAKFGWTYRRQLDNRWTVYQRAVDTGWVTELASSHYHPRTGELVLDAPQVRITVKGLAELQKTCGLAGVHMHRLRSTFGTEAFEACNNILAVQRLLGHASVATTQIYVGVSDDAMQQAVAGLRAA